jgi:putative heme-binding domain-containing protein
LASSPDLEVRRLSQSLALTFGDSEAMQALRKVISDEKAPLEDRQWAIASLAQARDPKLLPILEKLIVTVPLREAALTALAAYDSPKTPALILKQYSLLNPTERQTALFTLVSRPTYAAELLGAVEANQIPARDLSTYLVRQIAAFENEPLNAKLRKVWGEFRPTTADKAQQIQTLKSQMTEESLKKADANEGRVVFATTCAGCHLLFEEGRHVGPDLTGSQRNNLDYILENVFDPSAVVGRDYRLTTIATTDGRVLTGVVAEEAAESLTLKTPTEDVLLAKSEIEARRQSAVSMMPEGLLEKLSEVEIRNLIAYLGSTNQVPLPTGSRK